MFKFKPQYHNIWRWGHEESQGGIGDLLRRNRRDFLSHPQDGDIQIRSLPGSQISWNLYLLDCSLPNVSTLGVFIYLGSNFPEFEPKSMAFCDGRLCWLVDTNQWWTNYPSPQTEPEIDSENTFLFLNSVLNINSLPEQYDCYFLFLAQQWLHMLLYCQCHPLALTLDDCGSQPPTLITNSVCTLWCFPSRRTKASTNLWWKSSIYMKFFLTT